MSYLSGYGSGIGGLGTGGGYASDGGREPGARRKRLAAMAGRVYSAGATAVSEIKESYNQTRSGQADTAEASKITIPGSFPEVAIVTKGNEQMVLFPSYAKRHVKGQARQFENPAGPPHPAAVGMDDQEYWQQEWARNEDEKAIVDVDVRGWLYNPHRGPMTRRNRVLIGLARQLSGIPVPTVQQQNPDPSPASLHQQHEEEREQMRIYQEAKKIEQRGQAEKEAALQGGYSEPPKDQDSEDEANNLNRHKSTSSTPSIRSVPGSPRIAGAAGGTDLTEAELAVANANLMARIAPFMTTPMVQVPITFFFYNDTTSQSRTITTNDSGHFILRAALDFVPTHVRVLANEELSVTEPVQIIEPKGVSLISDIDDTIKHSSISSGAKEIFRNTFIRNLSDLTVDGVQEWYSALHDLGVRIHYCSNSPWQLFPVIATYFKLAGLPPGSIHLKQYSGMLQGIFEPVAERKKGTLEKIMRDFPERRFILVGDSGEADLEVYTEIAVANPGRIVAIFIRDVTTPEQTGYFDTGFRRADGRGQPKRLARKDSGSRHGISDEDHSRPPLPSRNATQSTRSTSPIMGDLIDFSEEPEKSSSRGDPNSKESQTLAASTNTNNTAKKAPPRPAKPVSLKSSPSISVSDQRKDDATGERKKPPPPPQSRKPSSSASSRSSTSHPLSQMHNSSQQSVNGSQQNLSKTQNQEDRNRGTSNSLTSGRSILPPPPPPRRGTASSMLSLSPRMAAKRRNTANSEIESLDSLPPAAYSNNAYGADSPSEVPPNKKLDLWLRRLQRAQQTLDREGVVLYTWRRGNDVKEEAVGIVRNVMQDMGVREGEGEIMELKDQR